MWGSNHNEVIIKVATILNQSTSTAHKLVTQLSKENYIIWKKEKFQEDVQFELLDTDKGRRFSMATAAAPISKTKATGILNDLIERAKSINKNEDLVFLVERIVVFGRPDRKRIIR